MWMCRCVCEVDSEIALQWLCSALVNSPPRFVIYDWLQEYNPQ